jgi:hypothetical protein
MPLRGREAARFPRVPGRLLELSGNRQSREMIFYAEVVLNRIIPVGQNAAYRLAWGKKEHFLLWRCKNTGYFF